MPGIIGDHDRETKGYLHTAYGPTEIANTEQLIPGWILLEKEKYKAQWEKSARWFN